VSQSRFRKFSEFSLILLGAIGVAGIGNASTITIAERLGLQIPHAATSQSAQSDATTSARTVTAGAASTAEAVTPASPLPTPQPPTPSTLPLAATPAATSSAGAAAVTLATPAAVSISDLTAAKKKGTLPAKNAVGKDAGSGGLYSNALYGFGQVYQGSAPKAGVTPNLTSTCTSLSDGSKDHHNTKASILEVSGPMTIDMSWRSRASALEEGNSSRPLVPDCAGWLVSDVVDISKPSTAAPGPFVANASGTLPAYVLQMTYSSSLESVSDEKTDAPAGYLYLGWLDQVVTDPRHPWELTPEWVNAAIASQPGGLSSAVLRGGKDGKYGPYVESWTAFRNSHKSNVSSYLGYWGVDPATDTVWGVVNRQGEFAVVPEPGTIALLGVAVPALLLALRRWRRNSGLNC
jgi:hypothetical protein